jgi:GDP-L-fucose synthase
MNLSDLSSSIYVAGHNGLVGSAIVRSLAERGFHNIIQRTSSELDLRRQDAVEEFFAETRPDFVVVAAARVGGILANSQSPVDFLADNLEIELNVIRSAARAEVKRLLFLGSSCVYPKMAPQPLSEDSLLTGPLEPTNEWYAVAKIAGIKLCEAYHKQYGHDFISLMPTNLYGPNDNFDLQTSHVLPALIRKFHEAKLDGSTASVQLWGSGSPLREFLHVDDMARACIHVLELDEEKMATAAPGRLLNVGSASEITIRELAKLIRTVVRSDNPIQWDASKPDGTPRKLLDVSIMNKLGWTAAISLDEGIRSTYDWFVSSRQ